MRNAPISHYVPAGVKKSATWWHFLFKQAEAIRKEVMIIN
jgi:hypothetical protein